MAVAIKREQLARLGPWVPAALLALLAVVIAWSFAAMTRRYAGPMGLPLDDSYVYLTYAKQFGRAEPFSYYSGGGYSAGSPSALWPMVLAPFWTLGARGTALVWVSFGLCAVLYAAVGVGVYRFVRTVSGHADHAGGLAAATMAVVIAPFAWCALSGMEVALTAALLVGSLLLLARAPREGRPSWLLVTCLAATSLARPEAALLVAAIVGITVLVRLRRRAWREAAWWLVPIAPLALWLVTNRIVAGAFFGNSGVATRHFELPGFDWTYWWSAVKSLTGAMLDGLFLDDKSPLVWPKIVLALFVLGSVRVGIWAWREERVLVGALVILGPFVMMLAVVASSGLWSFENYRHIAAALPLLFIPVGVALVPLGSHRWLRRAWQAGAIVLALVFAGAARPALIADMRLYAQGVADTTAQQVAIGRYLAAKLPDARVMVHDAGAIAYYGDGSVVDMLGIVTDQPAGIANHGPGARFEFLESLPPELRPTHFAYYPAALGTAEFFGAVLKHTSLRRPFEPRRLAGDGDMQLIAAQWDHVRSSERPLNDHTGWSIVDRVDVADLMSERAHGWSGRIGRRNVGDPATRWSLVERSTLGGLYVDGGRTIRERSERFTVRVDPTKPTRVMVRTGGQRAYPFHEAISGPVELALYTKTKKLGSLTVAAPRGPFSELTFNLPPYATQTGTLELRTEASGLYRVFHWFVLQPE